MLSALPLTFVAIVERGSITQAATNLNLAKSAVSHNLKRLEAQLGVKLATRTTRKFNLTPAGERYYARCKEILILSQMASTEMEDFGATPSGPIIITAPHAMIAPVIAPAMKKVMSKFSLLRPTVIADDKRLDLVAGGIDLSITVGPLPDSSLKAQKVGTLRDVLCVCPKLLNSLQGAADTHILEAIQSLPYIAHAREDHVVEHTLLQEHTEKTLRVRFRPTFFSNAIDAMVSFAREGLGVALLPDLAVIDELEKGTLVKVFPDYAVDKEPIYAVHAYDTLPPRSVREIIDAVKAGLKGSPFS